MADDGNQRSWRGLALSELLSTLISGALTVVYAAFDTSLFSTPPKSHWLLKWLTVFALSKWIFAFIDLCTTYPERVLQKTLDALLKKHAGIRNIVYARFSRTMDGLAQEIANLSSETGEQWKHNDRLQTANDVCDGCRRIRSYVATSTDAPYLPPSETKDFYARQAKKLPRNESRRLLVYDIEQLVRQLDSLDRLENLRTFHRIHMDHGLKLRYWPNSVTELDARLKSIVGTSTPLVDFGVVNGELIFGQALNPGDTDRVTGRGRVTTLSGEAGRYQAAFESLWRETAPECFPPSQLDVLAMLCDMRYRMRTYSGLTGSAFYNQVVGKIRNPAGGHLMAVDIAPDMAVWWREPEYLHFLEATIEAAQAGVECSRLFVFRRRFGTRGEAGVFVNQVIKPQVEGGGEVGMVFIESVLEHDVGIADFILDGSGWGFYLLPGDRFKEDEVSAARNLVRSEMKCDLEGIHLDVRNLVLEHGRMSPGRTGVNEGDLASWLLG